MDCLKVTAAAGVKVARLVAALVAHWTALVAQRAAHAVAAARAAVMRVVREAPGRMGRAAKMGSSCVGYVLRCVGHVLRCVCYVLRLCCTWCYRKTLAACIASRRAAQARRQKANARRARSSMLAAARRRQVADGMHELDGEPHPAEPPEGGSPPTPQSQLTLAEKVEMLRSHFGMAKELPITAVVENAAKRLGLDLVTDGLMARADECLTALSETPPASMPVATRVV